LVLCKKNNIYRDDLGDKSRQQEVVIQKLIWASAVINWFGHMLSVVFMAPKGRRKRRWSCYNKVYGKPVLGHLNLGKKKWQLKWSSTIFYCIPRNVYNWGWRGLSKTLNQIEKKNLWEFIVVFLLTKIERGLSNTWDCLDRFII